MISVDGKGILVGRFGVPKRHLHLLEKQIIKRIEHDLFKSIEMIDILCKWNGSLSKSKMHSNVPREIEPQRNVVFDGGEE